jgi:hypothetical protein
MYRGLMKMPNRANINRLIEKLETLPYEKFEMAAYVRILDLTKYDGPGDPDADDMDKTVCYQECNTACCIAGWANLIQLVDKGFEPNTIPLIQLCDQASAAYWLGISHQQARALFLGIAYATPPQGIRVLERLRDFDEVDWRIARAPQAVR